MAGRGTPAERLAARRYSPRELTEGEVWTARALEELREARYRPRAWRLFAADSLRRSAQSRRERPAMADQARRWGLWGGLAWIVAWRLGGRRATVEPHLLGGLAWWAAVWRMLDWHLGMAEGGDGIPRERLSRADAVTLTRFWLVPVAYATAGSQRGLVATIAIGGASDWLDGALARRWGRTRLGRDLDTTADLAFLGSAALAARSTGRISPVGFFAFAARQGVGLALALGAQFGRARRPAVRARPWGGALRVGGLALGAGPSRRLGTALLVAGCAVPPRTTRRELSPA